MSQVIFTIDKKDYPIGCPEAQKPRLEKLAQIVEKKETEVMDIMGANISHEMLLVMLIVAFTDELDRERSKEKGTIEKTAVDFSPVQEQVTQMIQIVKQIKAMAS
ncbi:MAG: cell division protein ZapA [Alphaproteobacteria bacterium]|nr:cell division protein ZapA [Alphaproteobacteria bacterium]